MTIEELVEVEKNAIGSFGNAAMLRDKIYLDLLDEILEGTGMSGYYIGSGGHISYVDNANDDIRGAIRKYIGRRKAQDILEE